ncbi:MAG TPA: S16 family serine protease [Demequinaceae bacterium]
MRGNDVGDASPELLAQPLGQPPRTPGIRSIVMALSGMVSALLIAVLVVLPAPFMIESAGPTFDVFDGKVEGTTLITIDGATTYPSSGQLRLTTVAVSRTSGTLFSLGPVVRAWLNPASATYPDVPIDPNYDAVVQQEWTSSQENATVAALGELGTAVPARIRIADFSPGSNAEGKLMVDDIIVSVDGKQILTLPDLSAAIGALAPGDPVTVVVSRAGKDVTATFATISGQNGKTLMGVAIDPTFDMPYTVNVAIDHVGGPSAGLIFTLAIVDLLTPQDELQGAKVAGTGTISPNGDVGPIGGIALKMIGARRAGVDWFLAPESNCSEVVGHVPAGLRVVSVANLSEAYDAIVAIGSHAADNLPTCS